MVFHPANPAKPGEGGHYTYKKLVDVARGEWATLNDALPAGDPVTYDAIVQECCANGWTPVLALFVAVPSQSSRRLVQATAQEACRARGTTPKMAFFESCFTAAPVPSPSSRKRRADAAPSTLATPGASHGPIYGPVRPTS